MLRQIFVLYTGCLLISCGNQNDIEISSPGIVSGDVEISQLNDSSIIFKNTFEEGRFRIGATEIGLGLEPLRVKIKNAVYVDIKKTEQRFKDGEFLEAMLPSGIESHGIQVNFLTTLASCRFEYLKLDKKLAEIDQKIKTENHLIEKQFFIFDLQKSIPNVDYSSIDHLGNSNSYGLLLGAFEQLAIDQEMSVSKLALVLCGDLKFDGLFNGINQKGIIQNEYPEFDEQVLKSRYAKAIYDFSKKEVVHFSELPMGAFANEISLSKNEQLFSKNTVNYSFDP